TIQSWLVVEDHVHPIVCGVVSAGWEDADAAVRIRPVWSAAAIRWSVQRRIVHARTREVIPVHTVVPCRGVVGGHVQGGRSDRHRIWKVHLLPTGGGFPGESRSSQQITSAVPKISHMRSRIGGALIKADALNVTVEIGFEGNS